MIARRVLEAVAPEEIALALAAADQVADRRSRASRAVELRVERARYDPARAERGFHACEPENRLVARPSTGRRSRRTPLAPATAGRQAAGHESGTAAGAKGAPRPTSGVGARVAPGPGPPVTD